MNVCMFVLILLSLNDCKDYFDYVSCNKTNNFKLYGNTNDTIYSLYNNTKLTMQSDGNLILKTKINSSNSSDDWIIVWQSGSYFTGTSTDEQPIFALQKDGNLVVYVNSNGKGWQSDTIQLYWEYDYYYLIVNDNGYAYQLGPGSRQTIRWTTNPLINISIYPTYNTQQIIPSPSPTINISTLQPSLQPTLRPTRPPGI